MYLKERYDDVIIKQVQAELDRQIKKWGVQEHAPLVWNAILGEEVGEVSKAILETWHQGRPGDDGDEYRKELIQVAAVAISAIRALDMSHDPHRHMVTVEATGSEGERTHPAPCGYPEFLCSCGDE